MFDILAIVDFRRTEAAFSIIALVIMFLGHLFALYTFKRPRYIHKRLTGLLHVMAGVYDMHRNVAQLSVRLGVLDC